MKKQTDRKKVIKKLVLYPHIQWVWIRIVQLISKIRNFPGNHFIKKKKFSLPLGKLYREFSMHLYSFNRKARTHIYSEYHKVSYSQFSLRNFSVGVPAKQIIGLLYHDLEWWGDCRQSLPRNNILLGVEISIFSPLGDGIYILIFVWYGHWDFVVSSFLNVFYLRVLINLIKNLKLVMNHFFPTFTRIWTRNARLCRQSFWLCHPLFSRYHNIFHIFGGIINSNMCDFYWLDQFSTTVYLCYIILFFNQWNGFSLSKKLVDVLGAIIQGNTYVRFLLTGLLWREFCKYMYVFKPIFVCHIYFLININKKSYL